MHSMKNDTLYFIAATFAGLDVVLDDCERWSQNPGRRKFYTRFAEAERQYRRLLEIGTRAENITIIGE